MSGPAGVQVLMTESEWYESLRKDGVWWGWKMRVGIEKDTDCFCVFFELTWKMGTKGWIQFEISTELEVLLYISSKNPHECRGDFWD